MGLGQMMLVIGALTLLGMIILTANATVFQNSDTMYNSEFGITAISLANSLTEEANGKMFDHCVAATSAPALFDSSLLASPINGLKPDPGESYRGLTSGTTDFNDFDDFNGLKLVYLSPTEVDSAPGYTKIYIDGIRAKFYVTARVEYVQPPDLDVPVLSHQTWHKKITVTVKSPSLKDTLSYPSVMSYWN